MLIPSQIIMTHVRPSVWLSGMEVGWGILTGALAAVQSTNQIYALRFFVGLLEAGCWPGMITLFSGFPSAETSQILSFADQGYLCSVLVHTR